MLLLCWLLLCPLYALLLLQCCLSSVVGRDAAVCALASCPAALRQLVGMLGCRDKVLTAAAGREMQDETVNELVSIVH